MSVFAFWTTVFPHDAFSAPLARPWQKRRFHRKKVFFQSKGASLRKEDLAPPNLEFAIDTLPAPSPPPLPDFQ